MTVSRIVSVNVSVSVLSEFSRFCNTKGHGHERTERLKDSSKMMELKRVFTTQSELG